MVCEPGRGRLDIPAVARRRASVPSRVSRPAMGDPTAGAHARRADGHRRHGRGLGAGSGATATVGRAQAQLSRNVPRGQTITIPPGDDPIWAMPPAGTDARDCSCEAQRRNGPSTTDRPTLRSPGRWAWTRSSCSDQRSSAARSLLSLALSAERSCAPQHAVDEPGRADNEQQSERDGHALRQQRRRTLGSI